MILNFMPNRPCDYTLKLCLQQLQMSTHNVDSFTFIEP